MLRDRDVCLAPATKPADWESLIASFMPALESRLEAIGAPWSSLTEERRLMIMRGLGTVAGKIPMLCFTEVPQGRELPYHHLSFGGYGVVVERHWLEKNGGDRVMYIGDYSPNSRNLFRVLSMLHISSLFKDSSSGQVLFHNHSISAVLDLLSYVERRENVTEFEWRIAGKHGFMGGKRNSGTRIPLLINDVEMILVRDSGDVLHFEALLEKLANAQSPSRIPKVLCQPEVLHGD
jgi:hypothetical protein